MATTGAEISSTTVERLTNLFVVSAPFGDISSIQRADDCHAFYLYQVANSPSPADIHYLNAVPFDECFARGDFKFINDQAGRGGLDEMALNAFRNSSTISEAIVFFTTNDCDPDKRIKDADTGEGCSGDLKNDPKDSWNSWQVWDMCLGKRGCDLME
jgi:hypothetical protein